MNHSTLCIINSGSSSIKLMLIAMPSEQILLQGLAERLGEAEANLTWQAHAGRTTQNALPFGDHHVALQSMLTHVMQQFGQAITAVGHRVVHGGEQFIAPTLLTAENIIAIDALSHLAPLHNPANLLGIRVAMQLLPDVPHVAVFDTAFHYTMPPHASRYAVPYDWYKTYGVRRYGFHGSSHENVAKQAAITLGLPLHDCQLITAHLGNGCSAAAISGGVSLDTTMGITPLEGLMMGTRSGDVDPGLHAFMARQSGLSLDEITHVLNRESGLLGVSGLSHDMRTLLQAAESGHERAALAIALFCYRLAKSIAALTAALTRLDAIIFTGGIGEHAAPIREKTIAHLGSLGVVIDIERNHNHGINHHGMISPHEANIAVLVIPTHEEAMIARHVCDCIAAHDITLFEDNV